MKLPAAWIDAEGSPAAIVVAAGLAAVRDSAGSWSDLPDGATIGALVSDGFKPADPGAAETLAKAARIA